MLIRKPARDVFRAIVDPAVTTKFWFTKSSGVLANGQRVRWDWEMYGVFAEVDVKELVVDERVVIEWGAPGQPKTTVAWSLAPRTQGTFVTVVQSGFRGSDAEIVAQAIDATSGFSFHLAGMKAWLEHGIELQLTGDHHPKD
jgi:uncharacterized protein YndB with AHSA1/START domain